MIDPRAILFAFALVLGVGCHAHAADVPPLSPEARAFLCSGQQPDDAAAGVSQGVDCDAATAWDLSHANADAPTPQQIISCRSDALRYCASHVGNDPAMRACMAAHWAQLSQPCRDAFR